MIKPQVTFPVAEGVGIFVGIVAWDLLTDGRVDIAKALLIAAPCAIAWFGIRYWKHETRIKPAARTPAKPTQSREKARKISGLFTTANCYTQSPKQRTSATDTHEKGS